MKKSKITYKVTILFFLFFVLSYNLSAYFFTFSEYVSKISTTETGVNQNIVTINDLETDYNYYKGLNYVHNDGTLPSLENKNLYNQSNLVETKINYYGYDILKQNHGYVSLDEQQDTYVYYKMYSINNAGTSSLLDDYLEIELIDNPFTDRPNDMGFHGWTTDYEGAKLYFYNDYYVRKVKIPVTYKNNIPNEIEINFYANWKEAKIGFVNSENNWEKAFSLLDEKKMQPIGGQIPIYESIYGLYLKSSISYYNNYPDGAVDDKGQNLTGRCRSLFGGCTYYLQVEENEEYNSTQTYYELSGNGNNKKMVEHEITIIGYDELARLSTGTILSGYYTKEDLTNKNVEGYYDEEGNIQSSFVCRSNCEYYKLINYYNDNGNINKADGNTIYYYLPTRDTNIIVMNANTSSTWDSIEKPFTLTSIYNDISYIDNVKWDVSGDYITCYADTTIENIKIDSNASNSTSNPASSRTTRNIFANYNNLKLGRGIIQADSSKNFNGVFGGNNVTSAIGSMNDTIKYKLIVESGFYNSITLTNGPSNTNNNKYIEAVGVYGNDYDKATNQNDELDVYFETAGSWGCGNYYASTNTGITFDTIIKSGSFGTSKYDHTTGVYVGGRSYGTHYTSRRIKVEGGWIYNLIGGPLTATNRENINDTYMYITGGSIDMIIGGAGTSTTYGNRIISITGGTVNYSVFGGSNSYSGNSSDGKLLGDSFVYIGGYATIGTNNNISNNNTLWGAESGSVFGIGNGNDDSETIGSNKNSNIIVDGDARILGNVYGGGNYSATGVSGNENSTTTNIKIIGGTIFGSVYGGGNKNGSGSTNVSSKINIDIYSGIIKENIYGGSKELGTIYGDINLNLLGGNIDGSVYGGGQGDSTKVSKNINITVGNEQLENLVVVNDSIYGGSEYGTVNGTNISASSYKTTLTLIKGKIDSVYGGGKGSSTITPYVLGDVEINVDGGNITNIYGGNENSGSPSKAVNIYLNKGTITNVYGGGNKTSLNTSNIYLNGSTVTNIYGGSNEQGDVNLSNITINSGIASNIYGGNNIGGVTEESNIIYNGGEIETIYGGGKLTDTVTTNIKINSGHANNIYGGGEESSIQHSNINVLGGEVETIYGGSNKDGEVEKSNIVVNSGEIETIYGGNNIGGITKESTINILGGNIDILYGGGNDAELLSSKININDGVIGSLYGGGNNIGGVIETSQIDLNSGFITNVYGGGNAAFTKEGVINLKGSIVTNVYGGGNNAGVDKTNINLISGNVENIYGGSNKSGNINTAKINTVDKSVETDLSISFDYTVNEVNPYWQDTNYSTVATVKATITNHTVQTLENYKGYIKIKDSTLYSNYSSTELEENNSTYSFSELNKYDSNKENIIEPLSTYTFEFMVYSKMNLDEFEISDYQISGYSDSGDKLVSTITALKVNNVYGGNNEGGLTDNVYINLKKGEYDNIYGGGNKALSNTPNLDLGNIVVNNNIYGGGNEAIVEESPNIFIKNSMVYGSIYGGGNAGIVKGDTNLYIDSTVVNESIFAGGNGITATVFGNSKLLIENKTQVKGHVYGGGNAASTGLIDDNSISNVYITGANIDGNVYGGGKTSVLYGKTNVNIGIKTYDMESTMSDISILGSIYGGGESNTAGSENYDYSHIGVTDGTNVNVNAKDHNIFKIEGSIFGSGNASTTNGESYINISNYGTKNNYKTNISLQRADLVTIDNSNIEFLGATDRTNEYSTVLFSISRIKHLKLKNNSVLYLNNGANLLEEYTSAVDIDGKETIGQVTISENEISKNVDNRIYLLTGKNLNIATNENATAYGTINGMTFFGMYLKDRDGKNITGYYDKNYNLNDNISSTDLYMFDSGSYVLGYHKANHNIRKDGFYSNFDKEGKLNVDYINPTPDDSTYYMWSIGEQIITMEASLTASKYITLGAEELSMLNYSKPNTQFSIVGFNYNDLDSNVKLVDENEVPRIAANENDADNIMSLVLKSTNSGWITNGQTTLLTSNENIKGTTLYKSENTSDVPTFQLYLYHSKNLATSGNMGSVTISFVIIEPIDDISNKVERVNVVVNLNRALYNTNDYEAAMTIGKEYDMFASTNVNLTADGSLSAYYSLFSQGNESLYKQGYHRSLVSTYAFPENTKLTLINLKENSVNEYYYYVITKEDYQESLIEYNKYGECSYNFSKFVRMGSIDSNNNFDDEINNTNYYDKETGISLEEFIINVDFADSNITKDVKNKTLLIELRNASKETIVSVLGIEQEQMVYNLYANSNAIIDIEGKISSNKIYPGDDVVLDLKNNFNRKIIGSEVIYDTNYFEQQLGVKIYFLDSNNNQLSSSSLLGVAFEYDGNLYYPKMDGSTRIKLSETMANVASKIKIKTTENFAPGDYKMVIESFGSADGIYYSEISIDSVTFDVNVLDTVYGLSMTMGDHIVVVDKETGNNLNKNNKIRFNVKYNSNLDDPNLRISLYRRDYNSVYSLDYESVDLMEYIVENLPTTNQKNHYLLEDTPLNDVSYDFVFKQNLKSGTYKLVISLYDKNMYIGDVYKYIIIKEKYNG